MKYFVGITVLCALLGARVVADGSEPMKAIVGSYLQIQSALASDKTDGVPAAATAIGVQAGKLGTKGDAIAKAARTMAQSADIKSARAAFGDLSDAVIGAARAEGWEGLPDAKVAYCAMAKRSWVQTDKEIRNPYYGSSMLTCGEFKQR